MSLMWVCTWSYIGHILDIFCAQGHIVDIICPRYVWKYHMSLICPWWLDICSTYIGHMHGQRHIVDIICPRYVRKCRLSLICPQYVLNMSLICPQYVFLDQWFKYVLNMSSVCPQYVLNMSRVDIMSTICPVIFTSGAVGIWGGELWGGATSTTTITCLSGVWLSLSRFGLSIPKAY